MFVVFLALVPFANRLYSQLAQPLISRLPEGSSMVAIDVITPFFTPLKMAFFSAIFITVPFLLYQAWAFVAPGLYRHERRLAVPLLASATPALAQTATNAGAGFQLNRYEPTAAGEWSFWVDHPWYSSTRYFAAGITLNYAHNPLVFGYSTVDNSFRQTYSIINHQLIGNVDLAGSFLDRVMLTLSLPVVLVVGLRLGCLNHALLSADAILAAGLPLAGWIANRIDPDMALADDNLVTLTALLPAPCLGTLAWCPLPASHAGGLDLRPLLAAAAAQRS